MLTSILGSTTATSTTSSATATRSAVAIDQTIDYWTFMGCWTESTTGRALASKTYADDTMTLDSCAAYCKGFQMFGVEYGRECKNIPVIILSRANFD